MDNNRFLLLKYKFRYFVNFLQKCFKFIAFLLCVVGVCFVIFRKKKLDEYLSKFVDRTYYYSFSLNKNVCSRLYIDGILYVNYLELQNKINRYCEEYNYTMTSLQRDILLDPWVKNVTIHKKLPDTLRIRIKEYNPFAVWINNKGEYKLIDEYGDEIKISKKEIGLFENLLIVVGDNLKTEVYDLFNLFSIYSEIAFYTVKATRVGNRRWNLVLRNGVIVKLPEEDHNLFEAWNILDKLLKIPELDSNLKFIDLRIENKIFLQYSNSAIKEIITIK